MVPVDLQGQTILMTGAMGAIAEHVVRRLDSAGATLALTDLLPAAEARSRLSAWGICNPAHAYRTMDVADAGAVSAVVAELFEKMPNVTTVLGHAGGCGLHPFASCGSQQFEQVFRFNFFGQVNLARAVLGEWSGRNVRGGHFIFTSSYVARVPHKGIPAYAPAKAALECLMKCLALEYAESGHRFNAVSPGNVAAGSSLAVYQNDTVYHAFVDRVTPMGRQNRPEAIADAVLFLASPLGAEVNGQILNVDGGITIPKIG